MINRARRLALRGGMVAAAGLALGAGASAPPDYYTDHIANPLEQIHGSGAPETLKVVFLGDGFTADPASMDVYRAAVDQAVAALLATDPFQPLASALTIYRLDVISDQDGIDVPTACPLGSVNPNDQFDVPPPPPGPVFPWSRSPKTPDNALETSWCGAGPVLGSKKWFLNADGARISGFLNAAGIVPDMTIVLVNDWMFGATAYPDDGLVFASIGQNLINDRNPDNDQPLVPNDPESFPDVVVHEIGHLKPFFLLDEYSFGNTGALAAQKAEIDAGPNLTTQVAPLKWDTLVVKGTPVPSDCDKPNPPEVSAYEGGYGFSSGVYRSRCKCKMDDHTHPSFCVVCRRQLIVRLAPHVPLLAYDPPRKAPVPFWVLLDSLQVASGPSGEYSMRYAISVGPQQVAGVWPPRAIRLSRGQTVEVGEVLGAMTLHPSMTSETVRFAYTLYWRPPAPDRAARATVLTTESLRLPVASLTTGLFVLARPTHRITLGVVVNR